MLERCSVGDARPTCACSDKHGYDYEDAAQSWVAGDVGHIVCVGDMYVQLNDIRTDIDRDAPQDEFVKWYDYSLRLASIDLSTPTPNYNSWLRGCPRRSEQEIAELERLHHKVEMAKAELEKNIMTANDITTTLSSSYLTNPKYELTNLYVFAWESDYLVMTRSGYWYEVEVKISRADFLADFKKIEKHKVLSGKKDGLRPNYFTYACPEGLIAPEEVPEYAGLIYIPYAGAHYGITVKPTPRLHGQKITAEQLNLTDKFYHNFISVKRKYVSYQRLYESGYIQPSKLQFEIIGNIHDNSDLIKPKE